MQWKIRARDIKPISLLILLVLISSHFSACKYSVQPWITACVKVADSESTRCCFGVLLPILRTIMIWRGIVNRYEYSSYIPRNKISSVRVTVHLLYSIIFFLEIFDYIAWYVSVKYQAIEYLHRRWIFSPTLNNLFSPTSNIFTDV